MCWARVDTLKGPLDIRARKGVVLAGGFPNDIAPSSADTAHAYRSRTWRCHRNPAPATASAWANPPAAFWKPMSPPCGRLGARVAGQACRWQHGRFPHIIERGKPGIIGVLSTGKRL
jgi:hypothetical protein